MSVIVRRYNKDKDITPHYEAVMESRDQLSRWFVWYKPDYSKDISVEFVNNKVDSEWQEDRYNFAVVDTSDDSFLGNLRLCIDRERKMGDLRYWIRTGRTGQGIATEALKQLIEKAFKEYELTEIHIDIATCNDASIKVAKKIADLNEFRGYGPVPTGPAKCYLTGCECPAVKFIIRPESQQS